MRAVGKKCFILPDWDSEDKVGELYLPAHRQRELPRTGIVQSIPDNVECEFKEGQRVVYDYHKQQLVNVPGQPMTLAHVAIKDVWGVFTT